MKILSLHSSSASNFLDNWDGSTLPVLDDPEYITLRKSLHEIWNEVKTDEKISDYKYDVKFGVRLKQLLDTKEWFTNRVATNIGFWRYISIMVAPDIVAARWGKNNGDHFWQKPTRIWYWAIWRYVTYGWQTNAKDTEEFLLSRSFFTEDTIQAIVERTGRLGTNIELYKSILERYGKLTEDQVKRFDLKSNKSDNLFRAVMRLNTARILTFEPQLYNGGCIGYVEDLFKKFNIEIPATPTSPTIPTDIPHDSSNDNSTREDNNQDNTLHNIQVILADITTLHVDAIVNAANSQLLGGGGVDGIIHQAAGPQLIEECRELHGCPVGQSKITSGYNLPCRYIIHTVGPDCRIPSENFHRKELLQSCYETCLDIVATKKLQSVAFCCVSTGVFRFPQEDAAQIALQTIKNRLQNGLDCNIIICCYTKTDKDIYDRLMLQH